jgi:hypothetical protein
LQFQESEALTPTRRAVLAGNRRDTVCFSAAFMATDSIRFTIWGQPHDRKSSEVHVIWIESFAMGVVAALVGLGLLAAVISVLLSAKSGGTAVELGMHASSSSLAYAGFALLFFVGFGIAYFRLR